MWAVNSSFCLEKDYPGKENQTQQVIHVQGICFGKKHIFEKEKSNSYVVWPKSKNFDIILHQRESKNVETEEEIKFNHCMR